MQNALIECFSSWNFATMSSLRFHKVRNSNVAVDSTSQFAMRTCLYRDGICFSQQLVEINEPISLRVIKLWPQFGFGSIHLSITNHNPAKFHDKVATGENFNKNWAKQFGIDCIQVIPSNMYRVGSVLTFSLNGKGHVQYGLDGEKIGVFAPDIRMNLPLYAVINFHGSVKAIGIGMVEALSDAIDSNEEKVEASRGDTDVVENVQESDLGYAIDSNAEKVEASRGDTDVVEYDSGLAVFGYDDLADKLRFGVHGKFIILEDDQTIARRRQPGRDGICFVGGSISIGEIFVVEISSTFPDISYGKIDLAVTNCNPQMFAEDLRKKSFKHYSMYWFSYFGTKRVQDIRFDHYQEGNRFYFGIDKKGDLIYATDKKKSRAFSPGICIDKPIYVVFNFYGKVRSIQLVGSMPADGSKPADDSEPADDPDITQEIDEEADGFDFEPPRKKPSRGDTDAE